ncbi:hypothetical protein PYW08_010016 [Mythimna loreyi]|uniref:Uncharacterized protein n=1 Tax=Mythimna loreyi TaxID=667449 RepID=A0ACC2Q7M8_9NEOP|nr:hypothetical protein PYW08_010016 [Mythimna loreyi]
MREEEIFQTNLERCSYRFLQQTAKAMGLPSNVKKVYLIQLINTKNYCSPRDLDLLVHRIREEQQHRAFARKISPRNRKRKNEHQSPEVSSTNHGLSPPISKTPKRARPIHIQYRDEMHSPIKYPQNVSARRLPVTSSDRVLRSSNRVTKPSYLLNNTLLSLLKDPDSDKRSETKAKTVSSEEKKRTASRIFAKKIIESWRDESNLASVSESEDISPPLGRQARRLSGVYPLQSEDIKLPNVAVRRADGSISKLRAIIQKPLSQHNRYDRTTQTENMNRSLLRANVTPPVITIQNSSYESSNSSEFNPNMNYRAPIQSNYIVTLPNTDQITSHKRSIVSSTPNLNVTNAIYRSSNVTEVSLAKTYSARVGSTGRQSSIRLSSSSDETTLSSSSIDSTQQNGEYYHKKIRAEQVRVSRRSREMSLPALSVENECRLPKIGEVFSKFNGVYSGNVTRPLYVQVENEPGIAPNPAHIPDPRWQYPGSSTLETIYNLKIPYQPVLQICTTTNTRTVYCTPVISTAKAQPSSTTAVHSVYNVASPPRENQQFYANAYGVVPRAYAHEVAPRAYAHEVVPRAYAHEVAPRAYAHEVVPRAYAHEVVPRAYAHEVVPRAYAHEVVPRSYAHEVVPRSYAHEVMPQAYAHEAVPPGNTYEVVPRAYAHEAVPPGNSYEVIPRAPNFFSNFHYHEQINNHNADTSTLDFQRSCSSVETMTSQEQELGANITIPEMVEDAFEIISQDGDYMERMGMDIRMQCILCNWAGPKIILEYHIRKDHPKEIIKCQTNEFNALYTLGGLWARRLWQSHVLELGGALYVLSAKYDDPDCFMAALSAVSYDPYDAKTGSLTIYNKVTGEPFTWTGVVSDLPPSMPYENDPNCFRLQLSKMDLLPNSANLKLLNRELVTKSPTKVIVGQPELDNIHINLTVKIFD